MAKPLYAQIRERFQLGPASHMTHVDNLNDIITHGTLRSYNLMRGQSYRNLANQDVQQGRAGITVSVTGRPLHDYVPLYFGFKTPMVAVNQQHNESLIFLRYSLDILARGDVVFSDGNARSHGTVFRIMCYSKTAQQRILAILTNSGIKKSVTVNPGWYFSFLV